MRGGFFFSQDLIDMTMKKMDMDKDGRICYADYEETVLLQLLLLLLLMFSQLLHLLLLMFPQLLFLLLLMFLQLMLLLLLMVLLPTYTPAHFHTATDFTPIHVLPAPASIPANVHPALDFTLDHVPPPSAFIPIHVPPAPTPTLAHVHPAPASTFDHVPPAPSTTLAPIEYYMLSIHKQGFVLNPQFSAALQDQTQYYKSITSGIFLIVYTLPYQRQGCVVVV